MMPSSRAPTSLSQPFASLRWVVAGDNRMRGLPLTYRRAKLSSFRRRSRKGRFVSARPSVSAKKSNTISSAGVSAASFRTRLCAGWIRLSRSSNENVRFCGTTISPSRTNLLAFQTERRLNQVGKIARQRAAGFGLQDHLSPIAKDEAAKAVPFGLIQPAAAGRDLVDRERLHRREGRTQCSSPARHTRRPSAGRSVEPANGPDQNQNWDGNTEQPQKNVAAHCRISERTRSEERRVGKECR